MCAAIGDRRCRAVRLQVVRPQLDQHDMNEDQQGRSTTEMKSTHRAAEVMLLQGKPTSMCLATGAYNCKPPRTALEVAEIPE